MLTPPPLPPAALGAGKIAVAAGWLFGLYALLGGDPSLQTVGLGVLAFLGGSHAIELLLYRAFLQAANATPADYLQVFLFGIFHSSGLKTGNNT